jgi:hypothetical protein
MFSKEQSKTGRECDLCESDLGSTRDRPEDEVPPPAETAADAFPRLEQLLGGAYVATADEVIRIGVIDPSRLDDTTAQGLACVGRASTERQTGRNATMGQCVVLLESWAGNGGRA